MHGTALYKLLVVVAASCVGQRKVAAFNLNCAVCPSSTELLDLTFNLANSSEVTVAQGGNPRLQCE